MKRSPQLRIAKSADESFSRNAITAALLLAGLVSPASAIETVWFGGTGDWGLATDWSFGVPGIGDVANIAAGTAMLNFDTTILGLQLSGGTLSGTGKLTVTGFSNWTGGTLTGTRTTSFSGGLAITGNTTKTLSAGRTLTLAGNSSWSANTVANSNTLFFNGGNLANTGSLTDANAFDSLAQNFSGTNAFNNSGSYTKTGAATTTVGVAYNNTGTTSVNAGALAFTNSLANTGILAGIGTVAAPTAGLANDGAIDPGISGTGKLTIAGNLTLDSSSALDLDLASLANFDRLAVTGNAKLGGRISVSDLGYTPVIGDSFVVMTFAQDLGSSRFSGLDLHGFAPGVAFDVIYNAGNVTLSVVAVPVPEPAQALMLFAGLGVLGALARRRFALAGA